MNQTKSLKLRMKSPYPYSLVLPALIVYGVLYVLPAASGFLLSFFNVKTFKISSFTFAGLENYATVLRNPYFSVAIKNTLLFFHCHDARKGRLRAGAGAAGKQPLPRRKLYADGFLPACRAEQRRRRAGVPLHDAPVRAHQPHADHNRAGCADAKLADQSENRHLLLRLCGDLEMDGLYDGHPACGASGNRHDLLWKPQSSTVPAAGSSFAL